MGRSEALVSRHNSPRSQTDSIRPWREGWCASKVKSRVDASANMRHTAQYLSLYSVHLIERYSGYR